MAGASEFPGFDLMALRGRVSDAVFADDSVTFQDAGMFQTGNQGKPPATSAWWSPMVAPAWGLSNSRC